jgi:hypothetical protein
VGPQLEQDGQAFEDFWVGLDEGDHDGLTRGLGCRSGGMTQTYRIIGKIIWRGLKSLGASIVDEQSIVFFVEPTVKAVPEGTRDGRDTGGLFGPQRELVSQLQGRVAVPVAQLREQVGQMVGMVAAVFDQADRQVAPEAGLPMPDRRLQLEEIELTVEVNAEGQLGILGNGGKLGGKGGIKLKFVRK